MAGKRQATSDLNHDNWDKEEEPEEPGTYRTASEEELKNRVIKRARKKVTNNTDTTGSQVKTIFGGFTGFAKPAASTAENSPFAFLSKLPQAASTPKASPTFSFFNSGTEKKPATSVATSSAPTLSLLNKVGAIITPMAGNNKPEKSKEYYANLQCLNTTVADWVMMHVKKNPLCNLSNVFNEYMDYFKELEKEEEEKAKDTKKSTAVTAIVSSAPPTPFGNIKFANTSASSTPASVTTTAKKPTTSFSFGVATSSAFGGFSTANTTNTTTAPAASTTSSNLFGSVFKPTADSSKTNGINFKANDKPTGFSFGQTTSTENQPANGFTFFPKPPGPMFTSGFAQQSEQKEETEEEPPKAEFKQVVEDEAVYSKRVKVFVKKDENYVDRGVGTLYLKPVKDSEKTQLIVRADTNLGNIIVNLILSPAIPAQRMGKNNVMLICVPSPDFSKPTSTLFRVKTGEEADELLEKIENYKGAEN